MPETGCNPCHIWSGYPDIHRRISCRGRILHNNLSLISIIGGIIRNDVKEFIRSSRTDTDISIISNRHSKNCISYIISCSSYPETQSFTCALCIISDKSRMICIGNSFELYCWMICIKSSISIVPRSHVRTPIDLEFRIRCIGSDTDVAIWMEDRESWRRYRSAITRSESETSIVGRECTVNAKYISVEYKRSVNIICIYM